MRNRLECRAKGPAALGLDYALHSPPSKISGEQTVRVHIQAWHIPVY